VLPVAYRLSLAVSLILLLSVVITAALNFLKFNQVTETLEASRYDFVTHDIKNAFEQNLTLGLPLEQIANGRALLERQAALDPGITRIETFGADGRVLYSTARREDDWARRLLAGETASSGGTALTETFSSRAIVNDFGQTVGGVVVYRSQAEAKAREAAILRTLMVAVTGATLAGVCIVALGASRLCRDVRERLLATAAALQAAARGTRPAGGPGDLLATAAADAMAEIDTVESELDRLLATETRP